VSNIGATRNTSQHLITVVLIFNVFYKTFLTQTYIIPWIFPVFTGNITFYIVK